METLARFSRIMVTSPVFFRVWDDERSAVHCIDMPVVFAREMLATWVQTEGSMCWFPTRISSKRRGRNSFSLRAFMTRKFYGSYWIKHPQWKWPNSKIRAAIRVSDWFGRTALNLARSFKILLHASALKAKGVHVLETNKKYIITSWLAFKFLSLIF